MRARLPARSLAMAALTLAMHAGLVAMWQHLPRAQLGGHASGNRGDSDKGSLQVRLVQAAPATAASVATSALASPIMPAAPATSARSAAPASLSPSAAASPSHALQRASNEWAYLPASQLDTRPVLESEVTLPFPQDARLTRGARVSAVLVLYVSAEGVVDRIEFAQSALPEAFARTAVESFSHVRLRPGIKDGRPRRAMMKIEVEFAEPAVNPALSNVVVEASHSWQD